MERRFRFRIESLSGGAEWNYDPLMSVLEPPSALPLSLNFDLDLDNLLATDREIRPTGGRRAALVEVISDDDDGGHVAERQPQARDDSQREE